MISRSVMVPLAMIVLATLFSGIINGNDYVLGDPFNNKVKINSESEYKSDCDEYDMGSNDATCADEDITTLEAIDIDGENNKVTSNTHVDQVEKCDEIGTGDNNASCSNSSENFL